MARVELADDDPRVVEHARKLRQSADKVDAAEAKLADLVAECRRDGYSCEDIATACETMVEELQANKRRVARAAEIVRWGTGIAQLVRKGQAEGRIRARERARNVGRDQHLVRRTPGRRRHTAAHDVFTIRHLPQR